MSNVRKSLSVCGYKAGDRVICCTYNGRGQPETNLRKGRVVRFVSTKWDDENPVWYPVIKFDVGHTRRLSSMSRIAHYSIRE